MHTCPAHSRDSVDCSCVSTRRGLIERKKAGSLWKQPRGKAALYHKLQCPLGRPLGDTEVLTLSPSTDLVLPAQSNQIAAHPRAGRCPAGERHQRDRLPGTITLSSSSSHIFILIRVAQPVSSYSSAAQPAGHPLPTLPQTSVPFGSPACSS